MLAASANPGNADKKSKKKKATKQKDGAPSGSSGAASRTWDYEPPSGFVVYNDDEEDADFDYDTIKDNDDLELWVIRIPDGMKAKHLDGLELPVQPESSHAGTLLRKHASYDVWHLKDSDNNSIGEETLRLSCLLPRKKKGGELYSAPKPISNHFVVAAQPNAPTAVTSVSSNDKEIYQNPERYRHPAHLLSHKFLPYGSSPVAQDDDLMEVDVDATLTPSRHTAINVDDDDDDAHEAEQPGTPAKPKKRKVDSRTGSTPKSKKTHATT